MLVPFVNSVMTAEVVVLNKLAVALAADSKVTVGRGGRQKTYDTVNKLFTLSKFHPIGVMVYGNSEFMGFPWETVIKSYRSDLNEKSFNSISEYADDFFRYLLEELGIKEADWKINVVSISADCVVEVILRTGDIKNILNVCSEEIKKLEKLENILSSDDGKTPNILLQYKSEFKEAIRIFFDGENKDILDFKLARKLFRLMKLTIEKEIFSSYMSGIVFAGFGDDEKFPTIVDYSLDGIISGILKKKKVGSIDSDRRSEGYIKAFAQTDMVYRFMEGVDINYQSFVEGLFVQQLIEKLSAVADLRYRNNKTKRKIEKKRLIKEAISGIQEIKSEAKKYRWQQFSQPILNMLNAMPKEEIAGLAEALVSLTSLKRRVSEDEETVSGPIDVAVISKGDGFIWIKRKHYFDPAKNPYFFDKYYKV